MTSQERYVVSMVIALALTLSGETSLRAQSSDPFIDVKAFGALGDGKTDDTINIKKALTYASGLTKPEVFFPAGTYVISQTLTITSPMRLVGTSAELTGGSTIRMTVPTADTISLATGAAGSAIEGLSIAPLPAQTSGAGIRINFTTSNDGSGMTPLRIENVFVSNAYDGIYIQAANNVYLSDLLIVANSHDGLRLGISPSPPPAPQFTVTGVTLRSSTLSSGPSTNANIDIDYSASIEMNNVQAYSGGHGILIANSQQFFFQGVIADVPNGDAYSISSAADLNFVNCWAAGSASGHGVTLSNVNNFSWMGGFIRWNHGSGILVNSGVQNLSVNNAAISSNGANNSSGSDTYGIYVNQPMTNLRVTNNLFGDIGEDTGKVPQTYALYFNTGASATANTAVIQGNQDFHDTFTNSYTSPWYMAGNTGEMSWTAGGAVPTWSCISGSLYSVVNTVGTVSAGTLYVCLNSGWHPVSYSN